MFIQKFFPESLPPVIDQAGDLLFLSGQLFRKIADMLFDGPEQEIFIKISQKSPGVLPRHPLS